MSKEMDEMRQRIFEFFTEDDWEANIWELTNQILSLQTPTCRLAVVRKDMGLPTMPEPDFGSAPKEVRRDFGHVWRTAIVEVFEKLHNANFVQEIKE